MTARSDAIGALVTEVSFEALLPTGLVSNRAKID